MQPSLRELTIATVATFDEPLRASSVQPETAPLRLLKGSTSADDTMALY